MIKYYCDICGQEIIYNKQAEKIGEYNYPNKEGDIGHACEECREEDQRIREEEFKKTIGNVNRRVKEFVKNKLKQKKKKSKSLKGRLK